MGSDLKNAACDPGIHKVDAAEVPAGGCMDADVVRAIADHLPEHLRGGLDQHAPPAVCSVRMQRICEGQAVVPAHLHQHGQWSGDECIDWHIKAFN